VRAVVPRAPAAASPWPDLDDLGRRDHPPVVTARLLLRKRKTYIYTCCLGNIVHMLNEGQTQMTLP
jgi:hypothetical protein